MQQHTRRRRLALRTVLAGATSLSLIVAITSGANQASAAPAQPSPLTTPWTNVALNGTPLPEYPRPQMTRPDWANLNGEWQLLQSTTDTAPVFGQTLPQRINVPFPVESALSGIKRAPNDNRHYLTYRRTFTVPAGWNGRRVQLHFGAVDWQTTVWVNGVQVGGHTGGYDRFEFDITPQLNGGTNELIVRSYDPTDTRANGTLPVIGKQTVTPSGIFYTPTSGIWQTVWLEPTPTSSIYSVDFYPNISNNTLRVRVFSRGNVTGHTVFAETLSGAAVVGTASGGFTDFSVAVPNARRWSPDDPFLYNLRISLRNSAGATVDQTMHYFGMREVGKAMINGRLMPTLNGQFVIHNGVLDQGFWPDGVYTAPTDAALAGDLQKIKDLGFNMVRKHIKVEPQRWFYHADRLGLLVWQDMPSLTAQNVEANAAQQAQLETEMREIVDEHRDSPAVVVYVTYNEGWGERTLADTTRVANMVKNYDPTRLMNAHSGYNCCQSMGDPNTGDILDWHAYVGPDSPTPTSTRVATLGEYGGLGLRTPGHEYSPNGQWFAYEMHPDSNSITNRYVGLINSSQSLMNSRGLSALVYTEPFDVEGEVNGFWTYDRQVMKYDAARVRTANLGIVAASKQLNNTTPVTLPVNVRRSLQVVTPGFTDRSLRHAGSLANTAVINAASPAADKADATWTIRTGLANASCYSFESVNFPGQYLRHANSRARMDPNTGGPFAADATWCARGPLSGTVGVSLESFNFPGSYLRHYNSEVWMANGTGTTWNSPDSWGIDSTWNVINPWTP